MEQDISGKMCDECSQNPANVHVTQIANNETTVFHLCEQCAKKKGISISIEGLEGVVGQQSGADAVADKECPHCKTRLSAFREKGWLGCAACYQAFGEEIDRILVQVHGSAIHQGKRYTKRATTRSGKPSVKQLRTELENAIKNEDFEQAALLRDTINGLLPKSE